MATMAVRVERTFTVNRPLGVVVDYLSDFSHAEAWDPGTKSCTRTGSEAAADTPVAVGSTWHNVSEFRGREVELDYELTRREPDRLTFTGRNNSAISTDDLRFTEQGTSDTAVTYQATIDFTGLLKLAGPLIKPGFEKLADQTVEQLTATLNRL
jgi:carbon monoxide dehydrogenase subunit G